MKSSRLCIPILLLVVSCTQPAATVFPRLAEAPYGTYAEGIIANVEPQGWIKEFLSRQVTGLTGHPEALSYPYDTPLWAGELDRNTDTYGSDWWRYEQSAYYTDGLLRLGYELRDTALIHKGEVGVNHTLDIIGPDGRFGPQTPGDAEEIVMEWPQAVFFRAMQADYQATGDERIVQALEKHYLSFSAKELSAWRNFINIEGILWTYQMTGNDQLLQLAKDIWAIGNFDLNESAAMEDGVIKLHGVTCCESLKIPMLLYACTGEQHYLDAALNLERRLERDHMLPDGVPSSAEALCGKDPTYSHETCDISDYTWSMGYYLMTTGEAKWADRIEKAIFNAGPGAVTKDFKTLQYFSSPNQFIATGNSNNNEFFYGSTWMAYRPTHETECCSGNVHRFMPDYVARMWLRQGQDGVVAALYGPSKVAVNLPDGIVCNIVEDTEYPFSDDITFTFGFTKGGRKAHGHHHLSFSFRVPEGCALADVPEGATLNDKGFYTVSKDFSEGEKISLSFTSEVMTKTTEGGVYFQRGPLVYAYAIPTEVAVDTVTYANMNGKKPANDDFKCLSMTPVGDWNFAADTTATIVFNGSPVSGYPFDPQYVNRTVKIDASKVKGWSLLDGRFTTEAPAEIEPEPGTHQTLTLVPYGSTELRLTVFPVSK